MRHFVIRWHFLSRNIDTGTSEEPQWCWVEFVVCESVRMCVWKVKSWPLFSIKPDGTTQCWLASGSLSWCDLKLNEVSSVITNRSPLFQFISWIMEWRRFTDFCLHLLTSCLVSSVWSNREGKTRTILQGKVNEKLLCPEFQSVVYRAASSWAGRLAACLHRVSLSSLIALFSCYSGPAVSRRSLTVWLGTKSLASE